MRLQACGSGAKSKGRHAWIPDLCRVCCLGPRAQGAPCPALALAQYKAQGPRCLHPPPLTVAGAQPFFQLYKTATPCLYCETYDEMRRNECYDAVALCW